MNRKGILQMLPDRWLPLCPDNDGLLIKNKNDKRLAGLFYSGKSFRLFNIKLLFVQTSSLSVYWF